MSATLKTFWSRLPLVLAAAIGLAHPFYYWTLYGGDGIIHLVYAGNFLGGHPLQFNPGLADSGETSIGFMLLLAGIMKAVGAAGTPYAVKGVSLLSLYLIAFESWRIGATLGLTREWRAAAAIATLLLPGSALNGMAGTENSLFAALVLVWLDFALRYGWFSLSRAPSGTVSAFLGLGMGGLFWLRPEAVVVGAAAFVARGFSDWREDGKFASNAWWGMFVFSVAASVLAALYVGLFLHWSGLWPFGAGLMRRLFALRESTWAVLGIPLDTKVLLRIGAYFGIAVPAFFAFAASLRARPQTDAVRLALFMGLCFFADLFLHAVILFPNVHFARYTIYVWPLGLMLAARGLSQLEGMSIAQRWKTAAAAICIAGFLGVASYEFSLREDMRSDANDLREASLMPSQRAARSDALIRRLGNPAMRPVTIAITEVQIRYGLDARFVVRPLDGVTDDFLKNYLCAGYIDHEGYLLDRSVNFLLDFPNFNSDAKAWALSQLVSLPVGQSLERPGLRYVKVAEDAARIDPTVKRSSERTGAPPCR